jgi:putative transposase
MKLTGVSQLWVADITYIRLKAEFLYVAVILDGYSRKVVGWALDRTLAIRRTIRALEQAIENRHPGSMKRSGTVGPSHSITGYKRE